MKTLLNLLFLFSSLSLTCQNYLNQVLILNEGYYNSTTQNMDHPVSIGSYNPETSEYTTLIEIDSVKFASDMIVDEDFLYVAADYKLLKYDLNTFELISEVNVDGIRKILISENIIFTTIGDYDPMTYMPVEFDSYLHAYNKNSFLPIFYLDTVLGPKYSTQNLLNISSNSLQSGSMRIALTINNAFEWGNEVGKVGFLNINQDDDIFQTYTFSDYFEIDLGEDGKNPDNLFILNDDIYTINNKDWSSSSISKINLIDGVTETNNLSLSSTGCGTSCLYNTKILFQYSGDSRLHFWNTELNENELNELGEFDNFYAISFDSINNKIYASSTDYVTQGEIKVYNNDHILLESFNVGVSPGKILFDYRSNLSIDKEINKFNNSNLHNKKFDLMGRELKNVKSGNIYIRNLKKYFKN